MTFQTGKNIRTAFKLQSGLGAPASGAGSTGFYFAAGSGLQLAIADIPSETVRPDGQTKRSRNGTRSATAQYPAELRVGAFDALIGASMRANPVWTASFTVVPADITSLTTTTNTIVGASGSFLTKGLRRGMMVQLANATSHPENNGKWFPVLGVTAGAVTLPANSLTADGTPDTTFTITVAKTLTNPTTPVENYFSFEDYLADIAKSLYGTDLKVAKVSIVAAPNKKVMITFSLSGLDIQDLDGGTTPTAPAFSNPTFSTSIALVMSDGYIRLNGTDFTNALTGLTITYDIGGNATPTLAKTAPDVFMNSGKLSGSLNILRSDLALFRAARAETPYEIFAIFNEPGSDPIPFISAYMGDVKLSPSTAQNGNDGAQNASINWAGGVDENGGDHALTSILWSSSAP